MPSVKPIAIVLAVLSIVLAIGAGNEWMTPVFLLMGNDNPNSGSIPIVLLGQATVAVTVFNTQTARFGLTLATGMALLTWLVMSMNLFAALIGDNFEGPGGAGGLFILFMLAQAALGLASIVGLGTWKRQAGEAAIDPWAIAAVVGWALAFLVTRALS